ncbi:mitochondrial intermembrane space import and assembly protein 40 [Tanacetum coccineum]
MESLLAEATMYGNDDENASVEDKAKKALDCPCIQDLRSGPCGSQFSEAFLCFLKSTHEEKGSDCVHPFVALQRCIKTNPNAFPTEVFENSGEKNLEKPKPTREYIFNPSHMVGNTKPGESKVVINALLMHNLGWAGPDDSPGVLFVVFPGLE